MESFRYIQLICSLYLSVFFSYHALCYLNFWSLRLFSAVKSILGQVNSLIFPKTKQEFFTSLPSEIITDILARLPVRTIVSCKCVCKSWLDLLNTHEFAKYHLSKSVPRLAINRPLSRPTFTILEFEDGLDLEHLDVHYDVVTKFELDDLAEIHSSAKGLLFLRKRSTRPNLDNLYICNPITRDYIKLDCPQEFAYTFDQVVTYGFGVSRMTGQYKVVRILHDRILDRERHELLEIPLHDRILDRERHELLEIPEADCHVYTLGTGSWRRIALGSPFEYVTGSVGALLNGNLHWFVHDLKGSPWISCFDLEKEVFSTFSSPPLQGKRRRTSGVTVLEDCLCLSVNNSSDDEIVIWLMKKYGVENSWTKEFVISTRRDVPFDLFPIKVYRDVGILIIWENLWVHFHVCYYSIKNGTAQRIHMSRQLGCVDAVLHIPSFLSLRSFEMENVISF